VSFEMGNGLGGTESPESIGEGLGASVGLG
jgi:hypothetical protein